MWATATPHSPHQIPIATPPPRCDPGILPCCPHRSIWTENQVWSLRRAECGPDWSRTSTGRTPDGSPAAAVAQAMAVASWWVLLPGCVVACQGPGCQGAITNTGKPHPPTTELQQEQRAAIRQDEEHRCLAQAAGDGRPQCPGELQELWGLLSLRLAQPMLL